MSCLTSSIHSANVPATLLQPSASSSTPHFRLASTLPNSTILTPSLYSSHSPRHFPSSPAIRIDRSKLPQKLHPEVHTDQDLDACPTECVREIRTPGELAFVLDYAARHGPSLVVLDFYKTACGSCKYIEKGFAKLCRAEGELGDPVIFLKHNVMEDGDEEMSELADDLRIKAVPLFHFYLGDKLVDKFATRDKSRILETIQKYIPEFQAGEHQEATGE